MGGQPSTVRNVSTTEPSYEQQQLLNTVLPGIRGYAGTTPQRYQGSTIAPFNEAQTAGQNIALAGAPAQAGLAAAGGDAATRALTAGGSTTGNIQELLRAVTPAAPTRPDPTAAISAATRPIEQNLTERALPAIRGEFGIDNYGNSGRNLAEGVAVRGAGQAIGDVTARLGQSMYETDANLANQQYLAQLGLARDVYGRDASTTLQALGLLPQVQQAYNVPAATVSGVGDVQQAMTQAGINEQVGNFNWDQVAPFLHSQEILSLIQGLPGATNVSTGTGPRPNTAMTALGGAASGAALGSALFPGVGTAVGAAGGALLPFLLNR